MSILAERFGREINLINGYLEKVIAPNSEVKGLAQLTESMRYSLNNPGKRFRAVLSLLTARALDFEVNLVLPFAAAVELIHTYSLVHDDLPSMDDDDYRRGRPSNHKVYGDGMAVIAGDALLTLAFEHIAENYEQMPQLALRATRVLAQASGYRGMVGGQAIDIAVKNGASIDGNEVRLLHSLKTGALIQASTEGPAILCEANEQQILALADFGRQLGLAFQIADDLLDHREDAPEDSGFPKVFGLDQTRQLLEETSQQAFAALESFGQKARDLHFIAEFNRERVKS